MVTQPSPLTFPLEVVVCSNGLARIAGPGDPSPDGSTFFFVDAPTINASGQVAFSGETLNGFGVFLYSNGKVATVAKPGDRIPPRNSLTFATCLRSTMVERSHLERAWLPEEVAVFIARPKTGRRPGGCGDCVRPGPFFNTTFACSAESETSKKFCFGEIAERSLEVISSVDKRPASPGLAISCNR